MQFTRWYRRFTLFGENYVFQHPQDAGSYDHGHSEFLSQKGHPSLFGIPNVTSIEQLLS